MKIRRDPVRIQAYIKNLTASREENAYALKELSKSRGYVVPYLIDALRGASPEDRIRYLDACRASGAGHPRADDRCPGQQYSLVAGRSYPHLHEAILGQQHTANRPRGRAEPVVFGKLSLPARTGAPTQATDALVFFLEAKTAEKLPPARFELTRLAEGYYLHRFRFADPNAVAVWRWDGQSVVEGWPGRRPLLPTRPRNTTASASPARPCYSIPLSFRPRSCCSA